MKAIEDCFDLLCISAIFTEVFPCFSRIRLERFRVLGVPTSLVLSRFVFKVLEGCWSRSMYSWLAHTYSSKEPKSLFTFFMVFISHIIQILLQSLTSINVHYIYIYTYTMYLTLKWSTTKNLSSLFEQGLRNLFFLFISGVLCFYVGRLNCLISDVSIYIHILWYKTTCLLCANDCLVVNVSGGRRWEG